MFIVPQFGFEVLLKVTPELQKKKIQKYWLLHIFSLKCPCRPLWCFMLLYKDVLFLTILKISISR